jgi:hypothetical protein
VLRQGDMLVNQYPFYQQFVPIPKVDAPQAVPAPHFMDRVKDPGRAIERTLISPGTRMRCAS